MAQLLPAHTDDEAIEALTGQRALFSLCDVSSPVVEAARRHIHTGTTVAGDEREAARIIGLAALGWSERRIAESTSHSRNTVAAVLRLAEKAGKVEPVKDRVLACAAAAIHSDIELGNTLADQVRDGDGDVALGELASLRRSTWVGVGILADKEGPRATSITVNVGSGSVVQVVEDYGRRLAALTAQTDTESGVRSEQSQAITVQCGAVMPAVSTDTRTAAGGSDGAAGQVDGAVVEREAAAGGPGGGMRDAGRVGNTDGTA
jgi:hypothetical protein